MLVYIDKDFETIVPDYLTHINGQLSQMQSFLGNKQYKDVERLAELITDSTRIYGFLKAGHLASKIIFYSKYKSDDSIYEVIQAIHDYFDKCNIQYVDL